MNISTLRRLLFAGNYLPRDLPNFWVIALEFATGQKLENSQLDPNVVSTLIGNIE